MSTEKRIRSSQISRDTNETKINPNSHTLLQALNLTMEYGKEYSNQVPLTGEPGNFRFSKKTESVAKAGGVAPLWLGCFANAAR